MRTPATASVIAVEAAVAAVVVVVAAAGVSGPAWLLVAGLAGHGFKDLWQHRSHFVANTRWWPPFCLVVDWVVAAILVLLIAVGEESKGDQRAGHRPHVDSSAPGHLADVGAAGGLEHELLGGQGADERLLACLLLHAGLLSPGPLVGSCEEYLATSWAASDGTALAAALLADDRCIDSKHRST
jgi:hypothetical protein